MCGALQELNFDRRHAGAFTLGRLGGALKMLNGDKARGSLASGALRVLGSFLPESDAVIIARVI